MLIFYGTEFVFEMHWGSGVPLPRVPLLVCPSSARLLFPQLNNVETMLEEFQCFLPLPVDKSTSSDSVNFQE